MIKDRLKIEILDALDQKVNHLIERKSILYYIREDSQGTQNIYCIKNGICKKLISGEVFREMDARILSLEISPQGSVIALQVKELFKIAPEYYFYRRLDVFKQPNVLQVTDCADISFLPIPNAKIEQADFLLFQDEERFYYSHIPNLNDRYDVAALYKGKVGRSDNYDLILEAEDAFEIQPYLSNDSNSLWVRVLRDYYENDELFLCDQDGTNLRCVVPEGNGRCFYLGTFQEQHILLCSFGSTQLQLIGLNRDKPDFDQSLQLLTYDENQMLFTQSLHVRPAVLLRRGKLLCLRDGHLSKEGRWIHTGRTPLLLDLTSKKIHNLANSLPARYANMEPLPNSCSADSFYYICEPLFQKAMICKVTHDQEIVDNFTLEGQVVPECCGDRVEMDVFYVEDIELRVYRPSHCMVQAGLLHIISEENGDLLMRNTLYNYRSMLSPWMRQCLYAEFNLSISCSPSEGQHYFHIISEILNLLQEKYTLSSKHIFLFESGFLSSFSLPYALSFPEKIGGVAAYNLRTDFLRYENDACGFMVRDWIGSTKNVKSKNALASFSPLEIAKKNAKLLVHLPILLLCNDDDLLVPSIHSKRLAQVIKKADPNSLVSLARISEEDEVELYTALLNFLFTYVEGSRF